MLLLENFVVCMALLVASKVMSSREATSGTILDVNVNMSKSFEQWMMKHDRVYRDENEKDKRFQIFKKTVAYVEAFNNADDNTYEQAVNKFADLTDKEFKKTYTGCRRKCKADVGLMQSSFKYENVTNVPPSIDWNLRGAVSRVKSQGNCRACWAFSAVAAVEGINAITTERFTELSAQEILDCIPNCGCNGGLAVFALEYIKNHGLATERSYPYMGVVGRCKSRVLMAVHIRGYEQVPPNNESALMNAVAHQPVSVSIDTQSHSFRNYRGGVYRGDCGTTPDHDVTIVGYGVDHHGTKYWLVKNVWGSDWGEDGYIRMKRDVRDPKGLCGIAIDAYYPIL